MIGTLAQDRRSLVPPAAALVFLGGLMIAVWLSGQITAGNFRNLLTLVILLQAVWFLLNWRLGVYVFMVYVAVEGFIVNFFHSVPELNLLKDGMALFLFCLLSIIVVVRYRDSPFPRVAWMIPFLGFAVVYFAQVLNPALPNILVGLVGIRVTLLFAILTPVAYWFFESRQRVIEFFVFLLWLSVPISLFGIAQSLLGPAWVTSLSPGFSRAVFYAVGSRGWSADSYFRTFSTFVHTGGFAVFLSLVLLLCTTFWVLPSFRRHRRVLLFLFGLHFWALLTTGSRAALVIALLAIAILFLVQGKGWKVIPVLLLMPLLLWASLHITGSAGMVERFETLLDIDYVAQRNIPLVQGWLGEALQSDWAGYGAGYASVASRHAGLTPLNGSVVENALAKVRFEAGLPGFVLYAAFLLTVLYDTIRVPSRVRDPELRWLAAACSSFVVINVGLVLAGTPFDVSPTNTYLWFFLGFLARVPLLSATPAQMAAPLQLQEVK